MDDYLLNFGILDREAAILFSIPTIPGGLQLPPRLRSVVEQVNGVRYESLRVLAGMFQREALVIRGSTEGQVDSQLGRFLVVS